MASSVQKYDYESGLAFIKNRFASDNKTFIKKEVFEAIKANEVEGAAEAAFNCLKRKMNKELHLVYEYTGEGAGEERVYRLYEIPAKVKVEVDLAEKDVKVKKKEVISKKKKEEISTSASELAALERNNQKLFNEIESLKEELTKANNELNILKEINEVRQDTIFAYQKVLKDMTFNFAI